MIDHCISAFKDMQEERLLKIYITDCLQAITKNTTHYLGMKGMFDYGVQVKERWLDVVSPKTQAEEVQEDPRSCEEQAADIWHRINREQ